MDCFEERRGCNAGKLPGGTQLSEYLLSFDCRSGGGRQADSPRHPYSYTGAYSSGARAALAGSNGRALDSLGDEGHAGRTVFLYLLGKTAGLRLSGLVLLHHHDGQRYLFLWQQRGAAWGCRRTLTGSAFLLSNNDLQQGGAYARLVQKCRHVPDLP